MHEHVRELCDKITFCFGTCGNCQFHYECVSIARHGSNPGQSLCSGIQYQITDKVDISLCDAQALMMRTHICIDNNLRCGVSPISYKSHLY